MKQPGTPRGKALRGDVPAIPPPPDRAQWEKAHGKKPYALFSLAEVEGDFALQLRAAPGGDIDVCRTDLARFVTQAKAAIARDLSTIDRDEAIEQDTKLEHICERLKTEVGVRECDHVFFHAQDGRFWVYPA